jgi:hypothetical protein
MSKFILKKDWVLKGELLGKSYQELLYNKGEIFEPNSNGEYIIKGPSRLQNQMILKYNEMKSAENNGELLFEEIVEKVPEISLTFLDDDFDDIERNYRLQLDVKTTGRKAKEIEKYLRKTLQEML